MKRQAEAWRRLRAPPKAGAKLLKKHRRIARQAKQQRREHHVKGY